jgi:flagellar protein FliS
MYENAHDAYLESRVLSADPVELVGLLYQACTGAVRDARRALADGEIAARSRAITRASEIVIELASSLDRERGGEIATRLVQLYDYMLTRLTEANFRQEDAPLAEVLGLLATLAEAWDGVKNQTRPKPAAQNPWGQSLPAEPVAAPDHAWSF